MARKLATIRKEIASVVVASTKVRDRVHKVATWCLEHYKEHGDTSICSELVNSMKQSGVYRKALIDWFKKYGKLDVKKGNDGLIFTKQKGFDHSTVELAKADADPFWKKDTDTDATLPTLDVWKMIGKALEKDQLAKESPESFKEIKSQLDSRTREQLERLVEMHSGGGEKVAAPKTKAMH